MVHVIAYPAGEDSLALWEGLYRYLHYTFFLPFVFREASEVMKLYKLALQFLSLLI